MQKRKVNGEWVTELTKQERRRLVEAQAVIADLEVLHPASMAELNEELMGVLECIHVATGVYTEPGEVQRA